MVSLDVLSVLRVLEAMLIPMYFLIGGFGKGRTITRRGEFLLYNLFGG